MGRKEINFKDQKINKKDFYENKKIFKIEDIKYKILLMLIKY